MRVKELIEELKQLPQDDELVITALDDDFYCDSFEVHSPYDDGQAQEIILSVYVNDFSKELEEDEEIEESLVSKLNQKFNLSIDEFYNVSPDDSLKMRVVSYGKDGDTERFELDGIEFYKAEDEDLKDAVETCIDMEFMPEWETANNINSYNVDSIDYDEEDGEGIAYVTVFGEGADEA